MLHDKLCLNILSKALGLIQIVINRLMSNAQLYDNHKKLYSAFYDKMTKKHPSRVQQARKFTDLIAKLALQVNDSEESYIRTITPKKYSKQQVITEFKSLRVTSSNSKNTLDVNRSVLSRKSDSEKDKSECESKFFGVDWVYSSPNPERVYVFAILAAYILNQNSVGFFILRDKIDEEMTNNPQFIPPILLASISKYWQKIAQVVTKKKSYLWEKHLKEPVDRMPLQFNKLVSKIVAGKQFQEKGFSKEAVTKLTKEGRIKITNFNINFRELQGMDHEGDFKKQIVIGYLKHSSTYVLANKVPEYSEIQLKNRKARALIQTNIKDLLRQFKSDQEEMNLAQDSKLPKEKDKVVKDFFSKKLALLKST